MRTQFLLLFLLIPLVVLSQTNDYPNSLSNSFWVGFNGGATFYKGDFSKSKIDFYGRGEVEYFFETFSKGLFGVKAYGGYGSIRAESASPISIGNPQRNSLEFQTYFLDAGLGLSYLVNYKVIKPYITFGGYSTYWYKVLDQAKNEAYDERRNIVFGFFSELGLKLSLAEGLTLNLSGTLNYPNTDEIDGRVSSKKDLFFTGLGGFSIYFGGLRDNDKDGVPDRFDMCPKTPPGVRVDQFGCPIKEVFDSDGDGVDDKIDRCPDTPNGVVVDQFGCPVDSDGDGVPDYIDRCPGTPKEFPVDEKGCPLDSDIDGVLDAFDQCPNTPKGVIVDDKGCPKDSDKDGIPDYLDNCPNTPLGVKVNSSGCPEEQIKETPMEQVFILQGMTTFELGKSTLTENAKKELRKLAEIIKKYPGSVWRIEGHTDSQGSADLNRKLSQERADMVKKYLVSLGIPSNQLISEGMGENYPIADNKTEAGRQKNRRVVITKIN